MPIAPPSVDYQKREFRPVVTRETDGIRLYAYTKR
jgi:hypothetical protein